jgi:hypothetical protein
VCLERLRTEKGCLADEIGWFGGNDSLQDAGYFWNIYTQFLPPSGPARNTRSSFSCFSTRSQDLIQLRRVRGVAMTIPLEIAVLSLPESSTIEHLGDQGQHSTIVNGDNPFRN